MRRAALVAAAALLLVGGTGGDAARAGEPADRSIVLRVHDVSLEQLLEISSVRDLATTGGAALLAHAGRLGDALAATTGTQDVSYSIEDLGVGADGLAAIGTRLVELEQDPHLAVWVVSDGSGLAGDELGSVVVGPPSWAPGSSPRSLTSDSTRRDGVVVAEDIGATMCAIAVASCDTGGFDISPVDTPPPIGLYRRYLANRRMSVPIQTAAGVYVTFAGLLGVALLASRRPVRPWLRSLGAWAAISVVPLAVVLLLTGHLPNLSYATVLAVVVGGTALGIAIWVPVANRRGTLAALAWLGAATVAAFVLEAALGWTAALHTFLGGTQLDGGRFYGLPNVDIGLLLGASVFVALALDRTAAGVALLAAVALFAGLPFAGANLGAAVTLAAAAGLWWGLRDGRGALVTVLACVVTAAAGLVVVLILNRVLPGPPTHITTFVEGQGEGVLSTVVHRLETGFALIARNPFAILPVIGVGAILLVVRHPPQPVRGSFDRHPGWRAALLTILWGSVVAYLANDTGAAALGLGFGTALGGLLFVSLRDRAGMMVAS
ncbi:MAG: hypothetical protein ABI635_04255 [Actinomycetota bacterium]